MKLFSFESSEKEMLVAGPLAAVCAKALQEEYGDPDGVHDGDADRVSLVLENCSVETMQQDEDAAQQALYNAIYLAKTSDQPMTRIYATDVKEDAEETVKSVLKDVLTTDAGEVESVVLIDGGVTDETQELLASFEQFGKKLGITVYYTKEELVEHFRQRR